MSDEPWNSTDKATLQSRSTASLPHPSYTHRVMRSVAHLQTKGKSFYFIFYFNSKSILEVLPVQSPIDSAAIEHVEDQTNLGKFLTPYHCHPHSRASHHTSGYDVYRFHRTSATVTPDGEIQLIKSNIEEGVVVHKNWSACVKEGKCPECGWLGKGMRKYCFKV